MKRIGPGGLALNQALLNELPIISGYADGCAEGAIVKCSA